MEQKRETMKKAIVAGVSLLAILAAGRANAADVYPAPGGGYKEGPSYVTLDWAGFYAGVNGGGAWSEFRDQLACPAFTCTSVVAGFGGLSPSGGFGGGQIGYNWQGFWHPRLVLGVEADIQGAGIEAKDPNAIGVFKSRLGFFGTVRGRIGYAHDSSLVYFTGGFAYGGIKNEVNSDVDFVKDTIATGYVLGGGWEYKFTRAWSGKIEYQYINLGKNDPEAGGITFSSIGTVRDDAFHTVRAGINYRFGPDYVPLK
jgi:outer membrane immunogenic protein